MPGIKQGRDGSFSISQEDIPEQHHHTLGHFNKQRKDDCNESTASPPAIQEEAQ